MSSLLGTIIAAIVNALLGRFFPAHPKITPEVVAQAQKDRADALQSQKDARRDAEIGRAAVSDKPADIMRHDANQRD